MAAIIAQRQILFDAPTHTYRDNLGNKYTSCTTVIGQYHEKFDTKAMARACYRSGLKGNPKYAGKSEAQLIKEWETTTKEACDWGNEKHDFNDTSVKEANGYFSLLKRKTGETYTIFDVRVNPVFGKLDIARFIETGFPDKYPIIFAVFKGLVDDGWNIYSELTVYNPDYLISGMIDIIAIKDDYCFIVDWKTNAADIRFESGYFIKDVFGNRTSEFKYTDKVMTIPGFKIPDSVGHKYSLQVSTYGHLASFFGLTYVGSIIFHIRREHYTLETIPAEFLHMAEVLVDKPKTDLVYPLDMSVESAAMCSHFRSTLKPNTQINFNI